MTLNRWNFEGWKSKRWTVCAIALVSFAAGSLITARLVHINQVRADNNRVFELRVYHTVPGKVLALESRFRDTTSKLLAKHDLKVVGYWVPEGVPAWDNTFIFLPAGMSHEVDECVVPGGHPLGHPVTYNLQIVFREQLGPCVAKVRFQCRQFVRHGMINAKLKDAIAGRAHWIHVHPASSSERSSGKGNQGHAANRPSVKFPELSFPAVECHGSSLSYRKSIELM